MKKLQVIAMLVAFSMTAKEIEVQSKIESVSMFKNGLGVVSRVIKIPKNGIYLLKDLPRPVHGTFWLESDARVVTRSTKREFDVPTPLSKRGLISRYAGKKVIIQTMGENSRTLKGLVIPDKLKEDEQWSRRYQQPNYYYNRANTGPLKDNFITIKTQTGVLTLKTSLIATISSVSINTSEKKMQPVMLFTVSERCDLFLNMIDREERVCERKRHVL